MVGGPGRGWASPVWFLTGAMVGGSASGAFVAIGSLFVPPPGPWLPFGLVALVTVLVVVRDANLYPVRLPQNHRQVRQSVLHMPGSAGALMFGFELGTGVRTYLTGAAPYIAVTAAILADGGVMLHALLVGVGFGLGRGLVPIVRWLHDDADAWDSWIRRYGERTLPVSSALATALVAVAILLK